MSKTVQDTNCYQPGQSRTHEIIVGGKTFSYEFREGHTVTMPDTHADVFDVVDDAFIVV